MIGSFLRWMRLVSPPWWAVATLLAFYVMIESLYWWMMTGVADLGVAMDILSLRNHVFALFGCGIYGIYRAVAFHPWWRVTYREWLERTPWTQRHPLPDGPVHLVAQDVVLLGIMSILLHGDQPRVVPLVAAFLTTYLVGTTILLWATGERGFAYGLAFGLGLALRLTSMPAVATTLLVLLYAPASLGLRRSFARFPWPQQSKPRSTVLSRQDKQAKREENSLGWPLDQLRVKEPTIVLGVGDRVAISLLAGWFFYIGAFFMNSDPMSIGVPRLLYAYLCGGIILSRLGRYCIGFAWPISLLGRIATGRLLIPGYDKVLLAPLCVVAIAAPTPCVIYSAGASEAIALGVGVCLAMLAAFLIGPSYRNWALTGNHRIMPVRGTSKMI